MAVLDDWFDTLEDTKGFFDRMVKAHPDLQVLLIKYPGQAGSACADDATLNNKMIASKVLGLLRGLDKKHVFKTSEEAFVLLGSGNGANIALCMHTSAPSLNVSSVVLLNPFTHVDARIEMHLRSWLSSFGISATVNLDLFWHLFAPSLLSRRYLKRTTPPLAMQIAPGVGEAAPLDLRSRLCEGTLAHEDLRKAVKRVSAPVIILRGVDNPLVGREHGDAIAAALGVDPYEEQVGIRQCLRQREGCVVIDVDCGHRMLLESRSEVEETLDAVLAASRDIARGN